MPRRITRPEYQCSAQAEKRQQILIMIRHCKDTMLQQALDRLITAVETGPDAPKAQDDAYSSSKPVTVPQNLKIRIRTVQPLQLYIPTPVHIHARILQHFLPKGVPVLEATREE